MEAVAQSVFSYSSAYQSTADNVFDTLGFDMVQQFSIDSAGRILHSIPNAVHGLLRRYRERRQGLD